MSSLISSSNEKYTVYIAKHHNELKETVTPSCSTTPILWLLPIFVVIAQRLSSCLTVWDPLDYSTSVFSVYHYIPEFAQTYIYWVSDAIQPSHPLSLPSPLALNFSQHQGLFQCQLFTSGGQSIGASASVLPMNIQGWFPFRMDWLDLLAVKGTLKSLLQHHSSKSINSSALRFLYSPTLTSIHDYWKNHSFDTCNVR